MNVILKVIFFFLLFSTLLSAQNPHPIFRNLTIEKGLPSPEVHHCLQDSLGYMWFATDNGVSNYNGYEFRTFGIKDGLKHYVTFYLQRDRKERIWIATMHGHLYYIINDSLYAYEFNNIIEKNNPGLQYIADDFYIDEDDTKYISLQKGGLIKILSDGHYEIFKSKQSDIEKVAFEINERWLISHCSQSTSRKNPNRVGALKITSDTSLVLNSFISPDKVTPENDWIKRFPDNKIYRFNRSSLYRIQGEECHIVKSFGYEVKLKAVHIDPQNRILIGGLSGGGIRRYSSSEGIENDDFEQFLKGVSITSINEDNDGGFWITTIEKGVFYCSDLDIKLYDRLSNFPTDHVSAIAPVDDTRMYVGFRSGELVFLDEGVNKSYMMNLPMNHDIIYDLLFDSKRQELWMTNRRLNLFKEGNWLTFKMLGYEKNNQISSFTKFIEFDYSGDCLLGSHTLGFGVLDLNSRELVFTSESKEIASRTYCLFEDQSRRIWVGNIRGLFEFKNEKLISPYPFHPEFNTRVEAITELSNGTLVVGTKGEGVLLWNENNFTKIKQSDGLVSNMVENIHVDKYDQIWVGTLNGLSKIWNNGASWSVDQITISNGLPSNEVTDIISRDSLLWIATTKGLLKWTDRKSETNSNPPIIESILLNNEIYDLQSNPVLSHRNNNIKINVLSINYRLNGNIQYRLRLNEGLWNYNKDRSFYFANLSPGEYSFEIQAQDENRAWSSSQFLDFYIKPPFWRTAWFFAGIFLIILSVTWYFIGVRIKGIKQSMQQESIIQDLKYKALRAQMNPHFIFNCLNSIQNFILENDAKSANNYLNRFAHLIRGSLNSSDEKNHTLDQEIHLLENYLELEKLRFKNKFKYSIEVDPGLDLYETVIPPLLTQPIVENAIIHGMKYKTSGGLIEISFHKKDYQLIIKIKDNGPGIYQLDKDEEQFKMQYKSLGMNISQKRLMLANLANRVKIQEMKDEKGIVHGTLIELVVHQGDY